MTKEMQELIDRELNAALESGDAKLVDRALINSQRALADCQLKTAERVKTIAADHPVLVEDVKEIKALVSAAHRKPKVYSTSGLIYALMQRGVYEQCREWIAEQGFLDLVLATKEFTDDLENFKTIKLGLQTLLGYTDEQVAEVLAEAEVE